MAKVSGVRCFQVFGPAAVPTREETQVGMLDIYPELAARPPTGAASRLSAAYVQAVLSEMRRVLRPGGRVVIAVWTGAEAAALRGAGYWLARPWLVSERHRQADRRAATPAVPAPRRAPRPSRHAGVGRLDGAPSQSASPGR